MDSTYDNMPTHTTYVRNWGHFQCTYMFTSIPQRIPNNGYKGKLMKREGKCDIVNYSLPISVLFCFFFFQLYRNKYFPTKVRATRSRSHTITITTVNEPD